ncbi:MAG: amidohydrolase family protein [Patescibacteria group bacterium]
MGEILRLSSLVDPHVHFRTPGQEYKENFQSGSRSALAGGVTTVIDMPNNVQLVTSRKLLDRKRELGSEQSHCDIGFHLGTMGDEEQNFAESADYVYGLKIYMNNTTGGFVVADPTKLDGIFRRWDFPQPILVHAEGNTLETAIRLAEKYDRRLHVCHVSLADEVYQISEAKLKRGDRVSAEVTPHHLLESSHWSADVYHQMKPPLSDFSDMQVLWDGLNDGTIDMVATDHAPHTRAEKESDRPPSGVTGLETTLPVLLMAERAGKITLDRIKEVTHTSPVLVFGLPEQPDTFIEVVRDEPWEIHGEDLQTQPHTTPFEGRRVLDRVERVTLRGNVVYEAGNILSEPGSGNVLP